MVVIYNIIYILVIILYVPILFIKKKWHKDMIMRWGHFPERILSHRPDQQKIWFHAVSVGEVLAVSPLIKKLAEKYPSSRIICSCVTKTGYELARQTFFSETIVIYAPLDLSWVVRKYIRVLNPQVYISAETELWPSLFNALAKAHVPIILVNGRISTTSHRRYKRIGFIINKILSVVNVFCMQTQEDVDRLVSLGADMNKIRLVGNLKFDNGPQAADPLSQDLGLKQENDYFIAGSTHLGEEEIMVNLYSQLKDEFPRLRLILAPRHINRTSRVSEMIRSKGYNPIKFSEREQGVFDQNAIVLVDTIGHLKSLYQFAKIVFVGKTFAVGGGQNMIEPAFYGKPIIVGPHTDNFKDIVRIFLEEKAIIQVKSIEDLQYQLKQLLNDSQACHQLGCKAKNVVLNNKGALNKTLQEISQVLDEKISL